jgi:type I restriction enzyme R subunit
MFFDLDKPIEQHRFGLPHWHQDDTLVFITWRLADSLPRTVITHLSKSRETFLKTHPKPWDPKTFSEYHRRFTLPLEDKLDQAHGECLLKIPRCAEIVAEALHFFDGERYDLDCFVVMPNHVHVVWKLWEGHALKDLIHSIKSFSAHAINKHLKRRGKIWQSNYWDRLIRSEKQLDWTRQYLANNPKNLPPGTFRHWQK